jgi:acyl carrier protein
LTAYLTYGTIFLLEDFMEIEKIEKELIDCIKELQAFSGEDSVEVGLLTKPYFDLPNFDSLRALEVICELEKKLKIGVEIKAVFFNVDDKGLPPTVKEIAQEIFNSIAEKVTENE